MKPILFNTDMVRAILDGRKTVTRRLVKPQPKSRLAYRSLGKGAGNWSYPDKYAWEYWNDESYKLPTDLSSEDMERLWLPPVHSGDILYVRETWRLFEGAFGEKEYKYLADEPFKEPFTWNPSIHMPKEAARIFLRVTGVLVERLQDISISDVAKEGIDNLIPSYDTDTLCDYCPLPEELKGVHCYGGQPVMCEGKNCYQAFEAWKEEYILEFADIWDGTIPKHPNKFKQYPSYWADNPWVWVIEFEKISKEEALQ